MARVLPVILSGGFGTRLWPLSRMHYPKQFVQNLVPNEQGCLFEHALELTRGEGFLPPLVVCSLHHQFFALDAFLKLRLGYSGIILEPQPKNTAISVFLASLWARERYGEECKLLCVPSDHLISQHDLFLESLKNACKLAQSGMLATFGVTPSFAATGYGYIEVGEPIDGGFKVAGFYEKPLRERAEVFASSGKFLWNAGLFCFKAGVMLKEAACLCPLNLGVAEKALHTASRNGEILTLKEEEFRAAESSSIDYSVMERSSKVAVTRMLSAWSDVGDFEGLCGTLGKDELGNYGNAMFLNSRGNAVFANKLVVANGLKDVVIVETRDALLVSAKEAVQNVKQAVLELQNQGAGEVLFGAKVYRPWGFYEVLAEASGYKVKRIMVKPGCALSLQKHAKREESWVVASGIASVMLNDESFTVECGGAVRIPAGAKHRLENAGTLPLIVIETQTGDYLGEDDIVRYSDFYGRV